VPITRGTAGAFHLLALGFDAEGNGWAVGGRDAGGPFFAGTSPRGWIESAVEAEVEEHPEEEQVAGGDLSGVAVHGEKVAFAVGSALESGPEGNSEYQPRIFRLTSPAGSESADGTGALKAGARRRIRASAHRVHRRAQRSGKSRSRAQADRPPRPPPRSAPNADLAAFVGR
jgi:hypothetical protein